MAGAFRPRRCHSVGCLGARRRQDELRDRVLSAAQAETADDDDETQIGSALERLQIYERRRRRQTKAPATSTN